MFKRLFCVFLSITLTLSGSIAFGCTAFCLKNQGEVIFGKNYDWWIGDGMIFVNKRGMSKMSSLESENNVAKWVSKYGSVTFNQYGWEQPSGGMNETGLAIELMWLDDTKYPKPDERPAVDVLEWIQFQLDTSATTAEVIRNAENVRIVSRINLHYLVNDQGGNAATIEFLNGKLIAHSGMELPVAALTNDTYSRSMRYATTSDAAAARSVSSLDRFVRASSRAKQFSRKVLREEAAVDYAFETLADAAHPGYTQWSIVYDQKRMKIHFRTKDQPAIKTVDMHFFDYGCSSAVSTFDLNSTETGDTSPVFKPYTRAANRNLIERSFSETDFLKNVPTKAKDSYAEFPERFTCGSVEPLRDKRQPLARLDSFNLIISLAYIYKYFITS
jgi:penicillin V acylase-like amidase (Ntn superfamily)